MFFRKHSTRLLSAFLIAAILALVILRLCSVSRQIPASAAALYSCPFTVVIDPGHGGEDGGAVSPAGHLESDLNLEISKRLEAVLLFLGVPVVMTRTTADIDYPADASTIKAKKSADTKARVALIESIDSAVLVSIHQNFYPSAAPCGMEVLYAPTEGSQVLAEEMQKNCIAFLDPDNRRTAAPIQDSIYIMNHVSCPAVLVECGFLSNPAELDKLLSADYQTKLAAVLAASIFSGGGCYES